MHSLNSTNESAIFGKIQLQKREARAIIKGHEMQAD